MPRLSVWINPETAAILRKTMIEREISATEAVRRALALFALAERVRASGGRFVVVDPRENR